MSADRTHDIHLRGGAGGEGWRHPVRRHGERSPGHTSRRDHRPQGQAGAAGFVDAHTHAAEGGRRARASARCPRPAIWRRDRTHHHPRHASPPSRPSPANGSRSSSASFVGQRIPISHSNELRSDGPLIVRGLDYHTIYVNSAALEGRRRDGGYRLCPIGRLHGPRARVLRRRRAWTSSSRPCLKPSARRPRPPIWKARLYAMRYLERARHHLDPRSLSRARRSLPPTPSSQRQARDGRARSSRSMSSPKATRRTEIAEAVALREAASPRTPFMTINSIKMFADGVDRVPGADSGAARALSRSARPASPASQERRGPVRSRHHRRPVRGSRPTRLRHPRPRDRRRRRARDPQCLRGAAQDRGDRISAICRSCIWS